MRKIIPDKLLREICPESQYTSKVSRQLKKRSPVKFSLQDLVGIITEAVTNKSRQTFHMHHAENPLPGDLVIAEDGVILGKLITPALKEAHDFAGVVYDFYRNVLGRNSLDDKGLALVSSCHVGENFNNAFWNGNQMAYGDGDGKYFTRFTRALEVVGHELTHGVVQNTCNLVYWFEPGALNEHFADVFGITIKQWYLNQTVDEADWLVGPEIVGPEFPGKAIRTFKDEKAYKGDRQPKHKRDQYWGFDDNGGVHTNSGIPSFAYYLFCTAMGGNSYGVPIKIWYSAMLRVNRFCSFKTLANVTLNISEQYGPDVHAKLLIAWKATGIL